MADRHGFSLQSVARPIIRRLRQDDELADRVWGRLSGGNATASEKASLPQLLAAARGMTSELTGWCARELAVQIDASKVAAQVGVDLVSRQVRPVAWSLLDLLA
jgi:hypothetical protein